jgi:sialic acid synthase SpsE
MSAFVRTVREVEKAMGTTRRILHSEEKKRRLAARRSICAARNLKAGHKLLEADLDYRRPGYGIAPDQVDRIVGRKLNVNKAAGEAFAWLDLEP